jgi:SAM-dependent methyltransferase
MLENSDHLSWNPVWDEIFRAREWGKYPPEHVVRFVAANFYGASDRAAIRLLEIGCGPGANVWFMAREGFGVAAIDGSPTAIHLAQHRLGQEKLSADLRVGDFSQLPWPSDTFDGAVENVSLCCNRSNVVARALGEVQRVLKPGAPFLSSFFSDRTWGSDLGVEVEPHGRENIAEGPFAGIGFCLFLNRVRVEELFSGFAAVGVERVSRTMGNEQHLIEQFVVTCRKPA